MNESTAVAQGGAPAEQVGASGPYRGPPLPQTIKQASSHRTQSFTECPQSFTERKQMALRARRIDPVHLSAARSANKDYLLSLSETLWALGETRGTVLDWMAGMVFGTGPGTAMTRGMTAARIYRRYQGAYGRARPAAR